MAKNDAPLDEVSVLNGFLKKIPEDRFRYNEAETKWMKIFVWNDSIPLLYHLFGIVVSLSVSDSFAEWVFYFESAQWTYQRSRFVEAVKFLLQVKKSRTLLLCDARCSLQEQGITGEDGFW